MLMSRSKVLKFFDQRMYIMHATRFGSINCQRSTNYIIDLELAVAGRSKKSPAFLEEGHGAWSYVYIHVQRVSARQVHLINWNTNTEMTCILYHARGANLSTLPRAKSSEGPILHWKRDI